MTATPRTSGTPATSAMPQKPATASATPTIVLVGHGMVGQRFLEALAARGVTAAARVVVLCEEPRPAYDRVRLTSYFSGTTPAELALCDEDFVSAHGIELHLGDPAVAVDRERRSVTSRSGLTVGYDVLVLATGSYPFPGATHPAASSTAPSTTSSPSRSTRGTRHAPASSWAADCWAWRPPVRCGGSDCARTSSS
jgi:hypothetical protein